MIANDTQIREYISKGIVEGALECRNPFGGAIAKVEAHAAF